MSLDKLLAALRGVTPDGPNKWRAYCPIHEASGEHNPSLAVEQASDGKVLLNCFPCDSKSRSRAFVADVCHACNMLVSDLMPPGGSRSGGQSGSGVANKKKKRLPDGARKSHEWQYRDTDGAVRFRVTRYDLPDGRKTFVQSRPNGEGGWIRNMRGVERIPYRLDELARASPTEVVWIVEGEKKADILARWNLVATTNPGGAGKWQKSFAAFLRGRRVVVLPDNGPVDPKTGRDVGMEHAADVLKSLDGVAQSARVLILPGLPPKGGVDDWYAAGRTCAELLAVLEEAERGGGVATGPNGTPTPTATVDPASTHYEEQLLDAIGLDVLGEIEGSRGDVKVFSEFHRKTDEIENVAKLSYERLLQVCGPVVKAKVLAGTGDPPPDMFTLRDVRQAISLMGGFRRLNETESECGVGVWAGINAEGVPDHSVVLVGAGEAARWNGDRKLHRITKPRSGGRLLDLGGSAKWYDFGRLAGIVEAADTRFCDAAISDAVTLFGRWRWRDDRDDRCAWLITGLVLATWVQTIWAWRPHIAIVGESGTGKSTLFEVLTSIFGPLAISSSGSTAAGIRQTLRRSAAVMICDEFESGSHRKDILDMFRASSRGDNVLRGTTGKQNGQRSTLRHMAWIAAIESGLKEQADRNRFISLELMLPLAAQAGKLCAPPPDVLSSLSERLLAVAIRSASAAQPLAIDLKSEQFEGVHHRVVESYAVPAAMLATALSLSRPKSVEMLSRLLSVGNVDEAKESDSASLIDAIGASLVRAERETCSVAQLLTAPSHSRVHLETVGIAVIEPKFGDDPETQDSGALVFIHSEAILRHLLRGTKWDGKAINQILRRLPGAREGRCRLAGSQPRGVYIPITHFLGD